MENPRRKEIAAIVEEDKKAFVKWLRQRKKDNGKVLTTDPWRNVDEQVARAFIPPKLFEVVANPQNLGIAGLSHGYRYGLDFYVTDSTGGESKQLLEIGLDTKYPHNPDTLIALRYFDTPELRGRGVGTSFFTNLADMAKQIGFRFIVGVHTLNQGDEDTIGFFTQKLRWTPLDSVVGLPDIYRNIVGSDDLNRYTVHFLNPKDHRRYTR